MVYVTNSFKFKEYINGQNIKLDLNQLFSTLAQIHDQLTVQT